MLTGKFRFDAGAILAFKQSIVNATKVRQQRSCVYCKAEHICAHAPENKSFVLVNGGSPFLLLTIVHAKRCNLQRIEPVIFSR